MKRQQLSYWGEIIMQKTDKTTPIQKILSWIDRVISFPAVTPEGLTRFKKGQNADTGIESHSDHLCSGGYNEAFIFEHWASYNPRH